MVDPIEFAKLKAEVEALRRYVSDLSFGEDFEVVDKGSSRHIVLAQADGCAVDPDAQRATLTDTDSWSASGDVGCEFTVSSTEIVGTNVVEKKRTLAFDPSGHLVSVTEVTQTTLLAERTKDVVIGSTYSDPTFTNQHHLLKYYGNLGSDGADETVFTAVECDCPS